MNKNCTVYRTTSFIGKKWTLNILLELYKGDSTLRYGEIKKKIKNITPKILASRLKELEKEGLIKKKVDASIVPVKCDYSLTKPGEEFISIIKDIKNWALKWKYQNTHCEANDCYQCEF